MPARPIRPTGAASGSVRDVARWGTFCCLLVPLVLLATGSPLGGAVTTALGLAAVTTACWALLRRSERGGTAHPAHKVHKVQQAHKVHQEGSSRVRPVRTRPARGRVGAHRGGRRAVGCAPVK